MAKPQRALLPPEEEEKLKQIAASGSPALRQRAQAVLSWHEGLTANESAKRAKLTLNQVQYLWKLYRRKGLDLFMVEVEATPSDASLPTMPPEPPTEAPGTLSLDALLSQYNVDMAHARHVAALALQLFDGTMSIHRLPQSIRALLEAAALVHNLAYASDPDHHHLTGRDILLNTPIRGLNEDERRILACTTAFHRKKVKPESEAAYQALPEELRRDVLALTAILRVVDGLDYSQSQTTTINEVHVSSEGVTIEVEGVQAEENAKQAQKKADVWNTFFTTPIRVQPEIPPPVVSTAPKPIPSAGITIQSKMGMPPLSPMLHPTMSVARVGRIFTLHTLDRIEALLQALRKTDHSVLPTLAREVFRLSEAVRMAGTQDFDADIQAFAHTVETARLAAALAERVIPLADEPGEHAHAINEKAREWSKQSEAAAQLINGANFAALASSVRSSIEKDGDPDEKALISFHIGSILWNQLTALRSVMEHGTSVEEALAAVRRFQDHLVAFRSLLGPEAAQVLDMLSPLESYLSTILTIQQVMNQLDAAPPPKKGRGRKPAAPPPPDLALEAIRKSQSEMLETLADELPALWSGVNSTVFRRSFALAIAAS